MYALGKKYQIVLLSTFDQYEFILFNIWTNKCTLNKLNKTIGDFAWACTHILKNINLRLQGLPIEAFQ